MLSHFVDDHIARGTATNLDLVEMHLIVGDHRDREVERRNKQQRLSTLNALINQTGSTLKGFQSITHCLVDDLSLRHRVPLFHPVNVHRDRKSALTERAITDLRISHIVNATNAPPANYERPFTSSGFIKNMFEDRADLNLKYFRVPIDDISVQDIKGHFGAAHEFIHDAIKGGGRVLVHCFAGVSRSSTLVISYLMQHRNMSYLDAFDYVKRRRDVIQPNIGFIEQLKAFESELALQSDVDREEDRHQAMDVD